MHLVNSPVDSLAGDPRRSSTPTSNQPRDGQRQHRHFENLLEIATLCRGDAASACAGTRRCTKLPRDLAPYLPATVHRRAKGQAPHLGL